MNYDDVLWAMKVIGLTGVGIGLLVGLSIVGLSL